MAVLATLKIIFDCTLVATAVILALVLPGGSEGVREGTILAAFGMGMVIRPLGNLEAWLHATRKW